MSKVIVIGLDAACLEILMPWIELGKLPNIDSIFRDGTYGNMRSVVPPMTPSAWYSVVTGKNPGKHGVFDWFEPGTDGYQRKLVSSASNRAKCIWDYLSESNRRSIVINVPVTHPPRPLKGILIPGYLSPKDPVTYPPGILDEFEQIHGPYAVYSDNEGRKASVRSMVEGYMQMTRLRTEAGLYYARKIDWDFFMIQFQKTDSVFHELDKPEHEPARLQVYQCVDECIGRIRQTVGKDANIILVSDHGIGQCEWTCCLNTWLEKNGLLVYKTSGNDGAGTIASEKVQLSHQASRAEAAFRRLMRLAGRLGITVETLHGMLEKMHLTVIEKMVPEYMAHSVARKQIDWARTQAFNTTPSSHGIRINMRGRESQGIVEPGEPSRRLVEDLVRELQNLQTPSGEPAFDSVLLREMCFTGAESNQGPDIMLVPSDSGPGLRFASFGKTFRYFGGYGHKMNGMFAAAGPDIRRNGLLESHLSILDVAPSVLYLTGLGIPPDLDGRPLAEMFGDPVIRHDTCCWNENPFSKAEISSKVRTIKKAVKI